MRIPLLALMALLMLGAPARARDAGHAPPGRLPVLVVVPLDYPAFRTHDSVPNAVPLRAVVLFDHPAARDTSVVILNPEHADARTLYEALSVIRRGAPARGTNKVGNYVPIGIRPGVREPEGAIRSRLEAFLAALASREATPLRTFQVHARTARLGDAREFFPPQPPQR